MLVMFLSYVSLSLKMSIFLTFCTILPPDPQHSRSTSYLAYLMGHSFLFSQIGTNLLLASSLKAVVVNFFVLSQLVLNHPCDVDVTILYTFSK